MGRILVVGYEESLLLTRTTILNTRWPTKIAYPKDVFTILKNEPMDVVVLCHSLTRREAAVLFYGIKRDFPYVQVLALESEPGSAAHLGACAKAVSTHGPEEMFAAIAALLELRDLRVA